MVLWVTSRHLFYPKSYMLQMHTTAPCFPKRPYKEIVCKREWQSILMGVDAAFRSTRKQLKLVLRAIPAISKRYRSGIVRRTRGH